VLVENHTIDEPNNQSCAFVLNPLLCKILEFDHPNQHSCGQPQTEHNAFCLTPQNGQLVIRILWTETRALEIHHNPTIRATERYAIKNI